MKNDKRLFIEWLRPENYKIKKISEYSDKIKAFEYFVMKIYDDLGKHDKNDLGILKTQLLLFLVTNASLDSKTILPDIGLLSIFDNWWGLPYGVIEKDIYEYILSHDGQFNGFKLTIFGLEITKCESLYQYIDDGIDRSIKNMYNFNNKLVNYNVSHISDIHKYYNCWMASRRKTNNVSNSIVDNDSIIKNFNRAFHK